MVGRLAFVAALGAAAVAASAGTFATDRFGYSGSITKYGSLADAQNQVNPVTTINVGNRDLGTYIVSGQYNIIMGSWWYTTEDNTNGKPKDDPTGDRLYSGYGNTTGNTGVGFMQLYEDVSGGSSLTHTSQSMAFSDFAGGYWTKFTLSESGSGATAANSFSRLTAFDPNLNDKGIYHSYALNVTAGGLQGTETSPGVFEAFDHPDSVSGTYSGLFENTSTDANNVGFYTFNFALNMTNWAFGQGNAALNGDFADSYFSSNVAVVPLPAAAWMGISLLGGMGSLSFLRKRRNAATSL